MPWVKDFDVDEAVDDAMKVFWAKGYEATSISDLTGAMKINKGSLYNAFGSKKALFIRALLKYDRDTRQRAFRDLEAMDDPIQAIEAFFDGLIAESKADTDRKGCLLVNTALELPNHDDDIGDMVRATLKDFEQFFERMVTLAKARGEAPSDLDSGDAARSLIAQAFGLRVLSRGAFSIASLEAIRTQAIRLVTT